MTSPLFIQTRKEVRALLPWTIGVAVGCAALGLIAGQHAGFPSFRHDEEVLFVIAYAVGVLAVAALSVGQELTHGTLAALLVQPVDRLKVLSLKLAVLAVALVSLGVLADSVFPNRYLRGQASRLLLIWGPVAAGIGLVPLLTILTRKPLGGVVFSVTIPGLILVISERFYSLRDGIQSYWITWYGTLLVSVIGLSVLVFRFRRLEAIGEGRQRSSVAAIPAADTVFAGDRPLARRNWILLVLKKELRLQQMTLAVSGLYVLAAIAVMIIGHIDPIYVGPTFGAISLLHGYFIALIAGSVASAEERHMGTIAGQVLQPKKRGLQWAIKSGVTVFLALALAIGLPLILMAVHRPADAFHLRPDFVVTVVLLASGALYVSALSSNSLWALLASVPVIAGSVFLGGVLSTNLRGWLRELIPSHRSRARELWETDRPAYHAASAQVQYLLEMRTVMLWVMGAAIAMLILYFASRHHRSLERDRRSIIRQVLTLGLCVAAGSILYFVAGRLAWSPFW